MHEIDDEVKWICPHCRAENVDWYTWTVTPVCEKCSTKFQWEELLSKDEFVRLEKLFQSDS